MELVGLSPSSSRPAADWDHAQRAFSHGSVPIYSLGTPRSASSVIPLDKPPVCMSMEASSRRGPGHRSGLESPRVPAEGGVDHTALFPFFLRSPLSASLRSLRPPLAFRKRSQSRLSSEKRKIVLCLPSFFSLALFLSPSCFRSASSSCFVTLFLLRCHSFSFASSLLTCSPAAPSSLPPLFFGSVFSTYPSL